VLFICIIHSFKIFYKENYNELFLKIDKPINRVNKITLADRIDDSGQCELNSFVHA